jgi:disease resistance protein RPM1
MTEDGEPHACRVHDAVLDLIISLSAEECFITTVLGSDAMIDSKVRWLSLHNGSTWPTVKMPKLRSVTIFRPNGNYKVPGMTPSFSSYRLLRVLDLRYLCTDYEVSRLGFLGSLSHLRYLGLSGRDPNSLLSFKEDNDDDGDDFLPAEIGNLHFLQTLDVYKTELYMLPSSITTLEQLVCLRGSNGLRTRLPRGLKKLTSLEVLESTIVDSEGITAELGHLTQLRVLKFRINLRENDDDDTLRACGKALMESLGRLTKLETLYINFDYLRVDLNCSVEEPIGNLRWLHLHCIHLVPTWIRHASLPGLSYLHLEVEHEQREDIQVLGTLPCLTHLHFRVMESCETREVLSLKKETLERYVVGPNAFPRLVKCEFYTKEGGVVPRTFQGGAMPRLQEFAFRIGTEFNDRRGPTVDDMVLAHLPSLRNVTVHGLGYNHSDFKRNEVKKLREKLEHEAAVHPNHPSMHFTDFRFWF